MMNRRLIIVCSILFLLAAGQLQAGIYIDIKDTETFRLTNTPSDESFILLLETREGDEELPEADEVQEAVKLASSKFKLPSSLIYSIIRGGRSFSGGGLMVLPDFATEEFTDTELQKTKINIQAGARRLQEMIDHFRGNLTLALGAYIAGIEKVEEVGGIPPDRRSQDFVANVKAAFDRYEKRTRIIYTYRDEKGVLTLINLR